MPDRHTARLDALNVPEPSGVRHARAALQRAQRELHGHLAVGAEQRVVDAARFRVQRAHDLLEARWHQAALATIGR